MRSWDSAFAVKIFILTAALLVPASNQCECLEKKNQDSDGAVFSKSSSSASPSAATTSPGCNCGGSSLASAYSSSSSSSSPSSSKSSSSSSASSGYGDGGGGGGGGGGSWRGYPESTATSGAAVGVDGPREVWGGPEGFGAMMYGGHLGGWGFPGYLLGSFGPGQSPRFHGGWVTMHQPSGMGAAAFGGDGFQGRHLWGYPSLGTRIPGAGNLHGFHHVGWGYPGWRADAAALSAAGVGVGGM